MKRIVLFAFCSMALLSAKAQDIIIFTSGEEVEAKVVEVSDTEVKYRLGATRLDRHGLKRHLTSL